MDIKRKIAALLAMTTAAGCTEAEALAASAKAAALMLEYNLTATEIHIEDQTVRSKTAGRSVRDPLWNAVARCTNTAPFFLTARRGSDIQFIGPAPGPDIAVYLFTLLNRAIDRAVADFKKAPEYRRRRSTATRRQAVHDFTFGMVSRLAKRLRQQFSPVMSAKALAEADAARRSRFPDAGSVSAPHRDTRFHDAVAAGWGAGGRVGLMHGVSGADAPRALGVL
ncbi:MAG: DUF2786 domain-containing protein [Paracoccus sp. (in: a-proteobacteria)]|nr:DUF2786 domain-containing protein [Paracoccus sp. (in: a-proteobacteria)]